MQYNNDKSSTMKAKVNRQQMQINKNIKITTVRNIYTC